MFEKMIAVITASILGFDALMLIIDEHVHIFPYLFGLDVRYALTVGLVGFGAISAIARRVFRE